ncbi:MAG: malic enzyme-like NAD(P)-binding protein [Sarcina ventriculi]|uniref:NADP-dependent malic enzyme n=1 Tax=Sarcina ventriculi TaxID=1267 RepID=A0ABP2AU86_SARVE|nr:malic enzyme-like NAD(P)-binding protein [Sarcina ventriculi]MDO4401764.1 malic enzyme-like NAD(P)-binding protein [Clostridiaceae bacterium]MBU5323061.1 NAD-dependent malic enzyme [Sarcina ventriculi]MCI5635393.1 NAD-dependent malic enzyme [Sarcina ventriculi]MDD7373792.1 NAD-dependent malic enzyme [Sarcina ventriculi]MDY7061903.1 malic enzyme-like NAD(P)-binding protein [Sarcina ventriculi]
MSENLSVKEKALKLHKDNQGKLEVISKVPVNTKEDLSLAYTPGVAEPCLKIKENYDDIYEYTSKGNIVAVVTNGTAVLGLGDIGAGAGLPVMEGKAVLFKTFAGVDAFPICLNSKNVDEIINTVKLMEPSFGGINLEDIKAPECFEIERRLKEEMNIPVFHDDQHGTAIVVLAAIINSLKVTKRNIADAKFVINGAGSAGISIAKLLMRAGAKHVTMVDRIGIIEESQEWMNDAQKEIAKVTNREHLTGTLADAVKGADAFIGVSAPGVLTKEMVSTMAKDSIVFAMANPVPEIFPDEAKAGGALVAGTGRSDYPNQVNNLLAFPGIFRGALDVRATDINEEMKIAAAYGIAELIPESELTPDYVIPAATDRRISPVVASFVAKAAIDTGVARRSDMTPEMVAEHTRELLGIK